MVKLSELDFNDLLHNAVLYLALQEQQQAKDASLMLVECEIEEIKDASIEIVEDYWEAYTVVVLAAPHALCEKIGSSNAFAWFTESNNKYEESFPQHMWIQRAFSSVLRRSPILFETYTQLIVASDGDWREHLRQLAQGKRKTNQGRRFEGQKDDAGIIWEKLYFRSQAEKQIAEALDRMDILYLPNCATRMAPPENRYTREPDFLICHKGKWGILQVDGREYHQQAALDHETDRQFKRHGIRVVERFTGIDCMKDPNSVVAKFLEVLERNG